MQKIVLIANTRFSRTLWVINQEFATISTIKFTVSTNINIPITNTVANFIWPITNWQICSKKKIFIILQATHFNFFYFFILHLDNLRCSCGKKDTQIIVVKHAILNCWCWITFLQSHLFPVFLVIRNSMNRLHTISF